MHFQLPKIIILTLAALILLAMPYMPNNYYTFLRIFASVVCLFLCYRELYVVKSSWGYFFLAGLCIFNPFVLMNFAKQVWIMIDLIAASSLVIYAYRPAKDEQIPIGGKHLVTVPFNNVMRGEVETWDTDAPSWWKEEEKKKHFFEIVRQKLAEHDETLADKFQYISPKTRSALKHAAHTLEERNFSFEQQAALIAAHMQNFHQLRGPNSLF